MYGSMFFEELKKYFELLVSLNEEIKLKTCHIMVVNAVWVAVNCLYVMTNIIVFGPFFLEL